MSHFSASAAGRHGLEQSSESLFSSPMAVALLVQMLVWTFGPALIIGNLHADTLEAAYWGRDWALGYSKHPPITTWLIDLVLRLWPGLGVHPILGLMALSQATVAIAAWYLWRATRLFASAETASFATLMYLASPAATFYAVQINHNSMLSPFMAATAYYGLRYLDELRWRDAVGLGVAAALGLWTKYEIVFVLLSLVALAILARRFRVAFVRPASYASFLVFAILSAPHVWWLAVHDWPSLYHAIDANKVTDIASLETSGQNLVTGVFALCVAPALMLAVTYWLRGPDEYARVPERPWVAATLSIGPPLILVLSAILTYKIIKPLWLQPFCVTTAGGMALFFQAGGQGGGLSERMSARISMAMSVAVFVGFAIYLVIAGAINKPLFAYSANTKPLAGATDALWKAHATGPLRCVVTNDRKVAPSGVLWLKDRPDYLDFSTGNWSHPEQIAACRKTGGVAVLPEPQSVLDNFAPSCVGERRKFDVPMMPLQGSYKVPVELVFIAPEGPDGTCAAR